MLRGGCVLVAVECKALACHRTGFLSLVPYSPGNGVAACSWCGPPGFSPVSGTVQEVL